MSKRVESQDGNISINPITGVVELYNADTLVAQTTTTGAGGLLVDGGSGLEAVVTASSLPANLVSGTGTESNNQIAVYTGANAVEGDPAFTWDSGQGQLTITHDQAGGSGRPALVIAQERAAPSIRFTTDQSSYSLFEINADAGSNVGFDLDVNFGGADDDHFLRLTNQAGSDLATFERNGRVSLGNSDLVVDQGTDPAVRINASTLLEMNERAAANAFTSGVGQIWVSSNTTPNSLIFTDEAGTDFVIGGTGTTVSTLTNPVDILATVTGDPTVPDFITSVLNFRSSDNNLYGTVGFQGDTLELLSSVYSGSVVFGGTNGSGFTRTGLQFLPDSAVELFYDSNIKLRTDANGARVTSSLYIDEIAAANLDAAGQGQLWVRTDVPNTLMFTDDTGQDIQISPYRATVQTTNATQTEIIGISVASGTGFGFKINLIGTEDSTGDTVFESIFGAIRNQGGTTALVGSTIVDRTDDAGATTWVITVAADDTADELTVDVTGEAAHTIDWKVSIEILDV